MLSLCFSFKTVGLHPSLPQYSPSPWNNFSFELLLIGIKVFLCSSPGLWSVSGINVRARHRGSPPGWEGRALSLPGEVKERACVAVCHAGARTSPQPLYSQEKAVCADVGRYEVFTKMPRGNMCLSSRLRSSRGCSGRHVQLKSKGFGAGLLLEGRLETQTGESRPWWSLDCPTRGKLLLFLAWRTLCL